MGFEHYNFGHEIEYNVNLYEKYDNLIELNESNFIEVENKKYIEEYDEAIYTWKSSGFKDINRLEFINKGDENSFRKKIEKNFVAKVKTNAKKGDSTVGNATLIICNIYEINNDVEKPLLIEINENGLGNYFADKDLESKKRGISKDLFLEICDKKYIVCRLNVFLNIQSKEDTNKFDIYTKNGFVLKCEKILDTHYDRIKVISTKKNDRGDYLESITLLDFSNINVHIADEKEIEQIEDKQWSTICFSISQSPIINVWLTYQDIEQKRNKDIFKKRSRCAINYRDARQINNETWTITFGLDSDTYNIWKEDADKKGTTLIVDQNIILNPTDHTRDENTIKVDNTRNEVILERIEEIDTNYYRGYIKVNKKNRKYSILNSGCFIAVQNIGYQVQYKRRMGALSNLEVVSEITKVLQNPSDAIAPSNRKVPGYLKNNEINLNPKQLEAIKAAYNNNNIVAVQGPPGTGKTRIIVEFILALRQKYKKLDEPLRLLITSTQNEAVDNAISKLEKENFNIFIHRSSSREDETKEIMLKKKKEIIKRLDNVLEKSKNNDEKEKQINALNSIKNILCEDPPTLVDNIDGYNDFIDEIVSDLKEYEKYNFIERSDIYRLEKLKNIKVEKTNVKNDDTELKIMFSTDFQKEKLKYYIKWIDDNESKYMGKPIGEILQDLNSSLNNFKKGRISNTDKIEKLWNEIKNEYLFITSTNKNNNDVVYSAYDKIRNELLEKVFNIEKGYILNKYFILNKWKKFINENFDFLNEFYKKYSIYYGATCQMSKDLYDIKEENLFDYVIIDEAARSNPLDLLIPISIGKKILIIGDHKQLPAIYEENIEKQLREDENKTIESVNLDKDTLFSALFTHLPSTNSFSLNIQYRMQKKIGDLVSKIFYEPELKLNSYFAEDAPEKKAIWNIYDNKPLVWVDYDLTEEKKYINENEIEIIDNILNKMPLDDIFEDENNPVKIGIITFYKEQSNEIKKRLEKNYDKYNKFIDCGTVDAFQGKEYNIVILSCVRNNRHQKIGFLNMPSRINVGISRAQQQLIIVGSGATFYNEGQDRLTPLGKIYKHIKNDNNVESFGGIIT